MAIIHPGGFDVDAWEKMRKASLSQEQSQEALLIAAQYMHEGKPLPMGLGEWLAGAIESAISSPFRNAPDNGDVGHALLVALGLRNNNRRKSADWLDVGALVESFREGGMKKTPAIKEAAASLGISYGTAQEAYRKYCAAQDESSHISRE